MRKPMPCPFCGCEPDNYARVTQMGSDVDRIQFVMECPCGQARVVRELEYRFGVPQDGKELKGFPFAVIEATMEEVVNRWNARVRY